MSKIEELELMADLDAILVSCFAFLRRLSTAQHNARSLCQTIVHFQPPAALTNSLKVQYERSREEITEPGLSVAYCRHFKVFTAILQLF